VALSVPRKGKAKPTIKTQRMAPAIRPSSATESMESGQEWLRPSAKSVEIDHLVVLAINFAVMHNSAFLCARV
jgi:hypothetical protein